MSFSKIPGVFLHNSVPMIDPAKLKVIAGYNVRDAFNPDTDQDDRELLASILANGFQTDKPVTVRIVGNDVYVVSGHRRFDAVKTAIAKGAKLPGIAIIPEGKGATGKVRDMAEMALDLVLSNSGKKLSPPEQGAAVLRMRECGMTDVAVAKATGFSEKWIRELAKLCRMEPRLRALVKAGVVSPTLALETVARHGAAAAPAIIETAAASGKGKRAGTATGATIAAVTGVAAKNGTKAAPVVVSQVAPVQNAAKAGAIAPVVPSLTGSLAGPFTLGTSLLDRTILDRNKIELCELCDVETARAVLLCLNQGWSLLKGKQIETAPVVETAPAKPVKVAPAKPVKVAPAKPVKVAPAKPVQASIVQAAPVVAPVVAKPSKPMPVASTGKVPDAWLLDSQAKRAAAKASPAKVAPSKK